MRMERRSGWDVKEALDLRTKDAREELAKVAAIIDRIAATPNPHWGHQGDMVRVGQALANIVECFTSPAE